MDSPLSCSSSLSSSGASSPDEVRGSDTVKDDVKAFVLYNPENHKEDKFYREVFEPRLASMGWKCTTANDFQSGFSWLECFDYIIPHCKMHFIFPMPNLQPDSRIVYMRDRLITYSVSNNDKSVFIPVRFTHSSCVSPYSEHLTEVKFDISSSDGNTFAWQQIQSWIDEFGEQHEVESVDQIANGDVFRNPQEQKASQADTIGEPVPVNAVVCPSSDASGKVRRRTVLNSDVCDSAVDNTRKMDTSVPLLAFHLKCTRWMTSHWFLASWMILFAVDLCVELDKTLRQHLLYSNQEQQQHLKEAFLVLLKMTTGIASMWCLKRSACSLSSLELTDSLTSEDILRVSEYMISRGILKKKSRDLDNEAVLRALKGYLSSSDKYFLVVPLVHTAVMVATLFTKGLFFIPFDQLSDTMCLWMPCVLINAVTTTGVIAFCQSAVSLYHVQYRILIDIYEVVFHRTKPGTAGNCTSPSSCGPGMCNTWEKLRNQTEKTSVICVRFLTAASVVQICLILYCLYNHQQRTAMDSIAITLLLFTKALSNCPSRSMKSTGVVSIIVLFLVLARLPVSAIPYGNIHLIIFRLLSIKLVFVLVLHYRLMVVAKDWPSPCYYKQHVYSTRLLFVVAVFLIGTLLDIPFAV